MAASDHLHPVQFSGTSHYAGGGAMTPGPAPKDPDFTIKEDSPNSGATWHNGEKLSEQPVNPHLSSPPLGKPTYSRTTLDPHDGFPYPK